MTEIPAITDPLGKHWEQPAPSEIILDNELALMTEQTFNRLAEYSCSMPSGVYPGKMWRSDVAAYHPNRVKAGMHRHWLHWFGECEDPTKCSNNSRKIIGEARMGERINNSP